MLVAISGLWGQDPSKRRMKITRRGASWHDRRLTQSLAKMRMLPEMRRHPGRSVLNLAMLSTVPTRDRTHV
jgi:hypothetical protein